MKKTTTITVRTNTRGLSKRARQQPSPQDGADIRAVAVADRARYADTRRAAIAAGKWLPPVPSLRWFIEDEIEDRRVAAQVREEMHVRERFEALAACF